MYKLNDETINSIERIVGLPIDEIRKLTPEDESEYIECKTNRKLEFPFRKRRILFYGCKPITYCPKYRTIQYVDNKIDSIVRNRKK